MELRRNEFLDDIGKRTRNVLEKNFWILAMVIIGAVGRIALSVLLPRGSVDMFAFVALMSISAGYATRRWISLLVPVGIMVVSDTFLYLLSGNVYPYSSALILMVVFFVWSGFAMAALIGKTVRRTSEPSFLWFAAGGVWSVLLFDVWTNFGWWLGPFYPNTIQGLAACFAMAIPFMLWHMASTLVLIPPFYIGVKAIHKYECKAVMSVDAPDVLES